MTEEEDKFRRWQICSPEVARVVSEFEELTVLKGNEHSKYNHHEDSPTFQEKFRKNVDKLSNEIEQLGNPFIVDDSEELIQLGTKNVMGDDVVSTVRQIEELGKNQHAEFRRTRILAHTVQLDSPIKKNKLPLFKVSATKGHSTKSESKELKMHIRLFSQMYISTQIRGGDLEEFFSHETLQYPPSLSKCGEMRSGNKSDLVKHIEPSAESGSTTPKVTAAVLEGSVLVNMTKPNKNQSFKNYCSDIFFPQVKKLRQQYNSERIDVVFDTYKDPSLKASTRMKRGKGIRRKVQDNSIAPTNWRGFLRLDQNKTELFAYLSKEVLLHVEDDMVLTCAYDTTCITNTNQMASSFISPCNHEEADTRVFLHVNDMSLQGHSKITIRTVDTDVLVLAVSVFARLKDQLEELWVDFGVGKHRKYVPIHVIFNNLGESRARGLTFFHAFTGCDQVSFLSHVTKGSAWKVWDLFGDITPVFESLSDQPTLSLIEESLPVIERFTVLLYNRTSNCLTTNECRKDLFCKGRTIDNIPPTSAALLKHVLRSSYIAGYVWEQSIVANQVLPDAEEWGWKMVDGKLVPHWTDLPDATIASRQLIKCSCNPEKGCKGRCKCVQSDLPCTELCKCKGDCERD